jgi:pyruvate/2-oxoglutarate dehydrogenase complex dihydrolipoamide acyltransferase (E2) component
VEVLPLTPMRRLIAEHMVRSLRTTPHAVTIHEVDMSRLVRWRAEHREAILARYGVDITYQTFVVKATCDALGEFPVMNSSWGEDKIVIKKRINVGIAVALDQGLIVPVVHGADEKSLLGLARAIGDVAQRAREGQLAMHDVQGGTFTVNNAGVFGSVLSVAVINQPQAAILTMEAIVKRVVVMPDDALAVRSMMFLSLSFDHRIVDGMTAGRFVQSIQRRLETMDPDALL